MMPQNKLGLGIVAFSVLGLASNYANAAAFAIKEQNVANLGYAYAGTAALAEDASIGYYNPAGLVQLQHSTFSVAAIGIRAHTRLHVESATNNLGGAVTGTNPIKPGSTALVPSLHMAYRVNDKWVLAFNVVSPFGLKTVYPQDSMARYSATRSEIKTINFGPSIGFYVTDKMAIGVGFDALYGKASAHANLNIGGGEGFLHNDGDGMAYGYHFGFMYNLSDATRMGLAYHSSFDVRASGDTTTKGVPANIPQSFSSKLALPNRIVYSVFHRYDEKWAALADLEWVHWSRLDSLRYNYKTASGGSSFTAEHLRFKNTIRFALGADYRFNSMLNFKTGVAFEKSPVRETSRVARIPDSDRVWLSIGARFQPNPNVVVHAGWAHLFFQHARINQSGPESSTPSIANQSLSGHYKSTYADVVGIQLTWNFV